VTATRAPAWLRAFNRGDEAALEALFAPDVVVHSSERLLSCAPSGFSGVKELLSTLRTAFPDLKLALLGDVGQGQTRVYTFVGRGTHRGRFLRVRPTGRPVEFPGRFMMRFDEGKVVEMWIRTNLTGVVPQLGMAPTVVS
jgi:predicted ester cyclase